MLPFKKIALAVSLIFIAVVVIWLFSPQPRGSSTQDIKPNSPNISSTPSAIVPVITMKAEGEKVLNTDNYGFCMQTLSEKNKLDFNWAKDNYKTWNRFTEQGYSPIEITLAVEYFMNRISATFFRMEQLRADTRLKEASSISQKPRASEHPAFAEPTYYSRDNNSQPKRFLDLSEQEKRKIIAETDIRLGDIANLMMDPYVPDSDILMLLNAVPNLSAVITDSSVHSVSLLDAAAYTWRPEILRELLNRGLLPTNEEYLDSTMEWALIELSAALGKKAIEERLAVVQQLMALDVPAHFIQNSDTLIVGIANQRSYRFSEEFISLLRNDYNVDLTQILQRDILRPDPNHPLIISLKNEKESTIRNALNIDDLDEFKSECDSTIIARSKAWQPKSASKLVDEMIDLLGKDNSELLPELSAIDPYLVDFFRRHYIPRAKKTNATQKELEAQLRVIEQLQKGDVNKAIEAMSGISLTDYQKTQLMHLFLSYDAAYYSAVTNSPLHARLYDYDKFQAARLLSVNAIDKLIAAGAPIFDADSKRKTLLFYAAKRRDSSLLTYLRDKSFTFSEDPYGQDPLHVALNVGIESADVDAIETSVNILMDYQPSIDDAHLSRMALIKHFYPDLYNRITDKHNSLVISADTPFLPVVTN